MSEATGSCRCATVKYLVKNDIKMAANCHCTICRKMTGGAFASIAIVDAADMEILEGKNALTAYEVSENAVKHFCSKCGSPIYNLHKGFPGKYMIPIGSLDNPAPITPAVNIHCENMLPWVGSIMEMTNFDKAPER